MGRRFAIVICVAAVGVMALGAQMATAGGPVDSTPPDLQLSGPKRQDPQTDFSCDADRCAVKVRVSCGDEECTARAKGKLTNIKRDKLTPAGPDVIAAGEKKTMKLLISINRNAPALKQIRKALDEGKKVKAKVTAKATDAAGNEATAKRTIKIVK